MLRKHVFLLHLLPHEQWLLVVEVVEVNVTTKARLALDETGTEMAAINLKDRHQMLPPRPILLVLQTVYGQG